VKRVLRAAAVFGIAPNAHRSRRVRSIVACLAIFAALLQPALGSAATLTTASVALSDPTPSAASVSYTFTGSSVTNAGIRCVKAVFSTATGGDTAPTGWSGASGSITAGSSTLVNSSGTGWSLATSDGTSSSGQKNIWKYTHSGSVTPTTLTAATFVMAGVTNASVADTGYYLTISTFDNTDCATTPRDSSIVTFINTAGSTLSTTIDPTISFSVNAMSSGAGCDGTTTTATSTATTIPFGTVSSATNGVVCQDLQAATNQSDGYTIYLRYTGKPSVGSNTIADLGGGSPVPNSNPTAFSATGTESYGYSTDDATLSTCGGGCSSDRFTNYDSLGHQGWAAASTSNAEVGYEASGVTTQHYHIGHQVGVATTTQPGNYTTTIVYTCTPVY
jgi:hypothetical protein